MEIVTLGNETWTIATARCCRDWPVFLEVQMGSCGYCRTRPIIVDDFESESL